MCRTADGGRCTVVVLYSDRKKVLWFYILPLDSYSSKKKSAQFSIFFIFVENNRKKLISILKVGNFGSKTLSRRSVFWIPLPLLGTYCSPANGFQASPSACSYFSLCYMIPFLQQGCYLGWLWESCIIHDFCPSLYLSICLFVCLCPQMKGQMQFHLFADIYTTHKGILVIFIWAAICSKKIFLKVNSPGVVTGTTALLTYTLFSLPIRSRVK